LNAAPAAGPRNSAWLVLLPGIAALATVMGIGRFVYTPILPEMLSGGVLNLREAGWVASANFVGYLVGAMAASAVRTRPWQSWLARFGLVLTPLMLAAMALTTSLPVWLAVRFAAGVASALALVFVSAQVLERLVQAGAAQRLVWLFSGVALGIIVAALLALAGQPFGLDWRGLWWVAAALSASLSRIAWRAVGAPSGTVARAGTPTAPTRLPEGGASPPTEPARPAPPGPDKRLAFHVTVLAYGLFGLGYVIHATYLPAMVRVAGYSQSAALWIWVLAGLAALPSMLLWSAVARRFGAQAAVAACYATQGLSALTPVVTDSIAGAAVAAVGLGGTFVAVTGIALAYVRSLEPERSARAIGVMTAAFGVGQIVGPLVAAYLADASFAGGNGFVWPSVLACAALLGATALMLAGCNNRPRQAGRPGAQRSAGQ
jgi:MFS family permease